MSQPEMVRSFPGVELLLEDSLLDVSVQAECARDVVTPAAMRGSATTLEATSRSCGRT